MVQLRLGPAPLQPPKKGCSLSLPSWVAPSVETGAALHVVKSGDTLATLRLDKSVYSVFGRNPSCPCKRGRNFVVDHPSISRQHAAIIHGEHGNLYLVDLGSTHGTFLAGVRLEPFLPQLLDNRKVISFGLSSRCYLVRLFPTEEVITHNGSPCYSAPLAGIVCSPVGEDDSSWSSSDDDDRTVVLHTGLNCFLSCVPQEESAIARRRSKTRGISMDADLFDSGCLGEQCDTQHTSAGKSLGARRVSFACSLPEVIPVSNDSQDKSFISRKRSCVTAFGGKSTSCENASSKLLQVAIDVKCANAPPSKFQKLQVVSTPRQRTPLTPIQRSCRRGSLDRDVRVATPVE